MADLDVVIIAYQRNHLLVQALEMLDRQVEASIAVIIVDDGSNVVPPFTNFGCVQRYLWSKHNGYQFTARLNEGLAAVSAPNVAFLSDDCIPLSRYWAKTHLQFLSEYQAVRGPLCDSIDKKPGMTDWWTIINTSANSNVVRSLGGFDMAYNGGYGYDDVDFGRKIKAENIRVGIGNPMSAVMHIGVPSAHNVSEQNRAYYKQKWGVA